jgi:hypothetical protein
LEITDLRGSMFCVADDPTLPEAGQQQSASPSAQSIPKQSIVGLREKAFLYVLLTGFLIGMFIFLGNELSTQERNFEQGTKLAKDVFNTSQSTPNSAAYRPDISLLYSFQFSRALEAAHIKTAAVVIGTLIVCLGSLVVVYGVEASYQITVNTNISASPSTLTTSSPGLLLITLGVVVIVVAQLTRSDFNTNVDWVIPNSEVKPFVTEVPNPEQSPTPKDPDSSGSPGPSVISGTPYAQGHTGSGGESGAHGNPKAEHKAEPGQ